MPAAPFARAFPAARPRTARREQSFDRSALPGGANSFLNYMAEEQKIVSRAAMSEPLLKAWGEQIFCCAAALWRVAKHSRIAAMFGPMPRLSHRDEGQAVRINHFLLRRNKK